MSIEDQINSLSRNEMIVLYWKCKGLSHEQIRLRLDYSLGWVQLQMSNVYTKLGFSKEMHWTKRRDILNNEVCPLVPKNIDKWEPVKVITEEAGEATVSDPEMMALVLYDEKQIEEVKNSSLIPPKPKETIIIKKPSKGVQTFRRFIFALIATIIMSLLGIFIYNLGRGATPAPEIIVITATFPPATDTTLPTLTSVIPTDTPFPTASPTQVPTNTPIPTEFIPPADGILFQDDFDQEISSEWNVISGTWIVTNGKLTKLPYTGSGWTYEWIALNKPEWKNFILSLDITRPQINTPDAMSFVVGKNGPQQLGIEIDTLSYMFWGFIGESWSDTQSITGNRENKVGLVFNLQIEVNNDTYTVRVNDREISVMTLSGYSSGEIKIGVDCDGSTKGCATIDNVKVTYLP